MTGKVALIGSGFNMSDSGVYAAIKDATGLKPELPKDIIDRYSLSEEDRALKTAVAYRRLLKSRHPQWSEAKIIKKIRSQFNIQIA